MNKLHNNDILYPQHMILLAIPCYNCKNQLPRVLDEINQRLIDRVSEIAVIDNGSTDGTIDAALEYQKMSPMAGKLKVFKNTDNYNLGGTHKVAFLRAEQLGLTHVVILHGDNQAKSDEANLLLDYIENHPEHQTILGSRFSANSRLIGYDWKRVAGNKILNLTYTIVTGKKCEDLGSGLNVFALSDLKKDTYLTFADKLTFNYELILDLIMRKVNFAYVPITWREEDQTSNARNVSVFKTALHNLWDWKIGKSNKVNSKRPEDYTCKEVTND